MLKMPGETPDSIDDIRRRFFLRRQRDETHHHPLAERLHHSIIINNLGVSVGPVEVGGERLGQEL